MNESRKANAFESYESNFPFASVVSQTRAHDFAIGTRNLEKGIREREKRKRKGREKEKEKRKKENRFYGTIDDE